MNQELTPWFPGDVKPIRVGVYQTGSMYQHWNGRWWGYFMVTPEKADLYRNNKSAMQDAPWRGLAKKP